MLFFWSSIVNHSPWMEEGERWPRTCLFLPRQAWNANFHLRKNIVEKISRSNDWPLNLSCFQSQWKDYKKHPSGDVLCVNVLFRLECCQIMVEIAIWRYIFGPLFGYLTRPTVLLKSNSFKGSFNQVKLYNFQNFFQGKVAVKLFWVAESLTQK